MKGKKFASQLLRWFKSNGRSLPWRTEQDPYKMLVAEKMLQQTDVGHVLKVYESFFNRFPNIHTLERACQDEIEQSIRSLGFWRIRARDLKRMAKYVIEECGGTVPEDLAGLEKIPGVGRYVSTAMACFCFGQQQAIVDVNVRRVVHRLFFWNAELPKDYELESIMQQMTPAGRAKEFNWAMLDFSAAICARRPRCSKCFANSICKYYYLEIIGSRNN